MRGLTFIGLLVIPLFIFQPANAATVVKGIEAEKILVNGTIIHKSVANNDHRFSVIYRNSVYFCLHYFNEEANRTNLWCSTDN